MSVRLHHIALGARQVEEVAAFYRRAFELKESARHHYEDGALRSIWLDLSPGVLMVEHTPRMRELVEGVDAGAFLIAFAIQPEERASVEARLQELGARIEAQSAYTLYARDPEGNRVALSHYPLPSAGE